MYRLKRPAALLLAFIMLATALSACGDEDSVEPGETQMPEENMTEDRDRRAAADKLFTLNCNRGNGFNPYTTKDSSNILVTQLMYDMLVNVDSTYSYTPNVIKDWKSDDGKYWVFTVDTGIKLWDGSKITANDVAYSIQRAMRSPQFSNRLSSIIGVSALDEDTVAVNIYGTNTRFPVLLCIPLIQDGSAGEDIPQGSGPYVMDEDLTSLSANTQHKSFGSLPFETVHLTEITGVEDMLSAFEDSITDLVVNDPSSLSNLGYGSANEKRPYNTSNMHYLGFNVGSEYFSNVLFRKAMNYIVDRENIATNIMNGQAVAATLPFHPASEYYNENFSELVSYSIERCEAALDEAEVQDYDDDGYREIMVTGIPLEIEIDFIVPNSSSFKVEAARAIAEDINALGVKVTLRELSWSAYKSALSAGDYDMYYAETMLTPDFNLRQLLLYGGPLNYGGVNDSKLDERIAAYMSANDDDRQKAADLMFKYITDTAPVVTICFEKRQVVTHLRVISGIRPTQYNIFNGIEEWEADMG